MMTRLVCMTSVSVLALWASTAMAQDQALIDAAKAEGQLTTIALPHDWCGYGGVIDGFKAKYPEITINELNPDAGSGDDPSGPGGTGSGGAGSGRGPSGGAGSR